MASDSSSPEGLSRHKESPLRALRGGRVSARCMGICPNWLAVVHVRLLNTDLEHASIYIWIIISIVLKEHDARKQFEYFRVKVQQN